MNAADATRVRYDAAFAGRDAPFAFVDLDAFDANAASLVRRAAGTPLRLASKSLRCLTLQRRALAVDGFRGQLCFTLPEALWLHEQGFRDLVVAYPTADRTALRRLAALDPSDAPVVMVDGTEQLDLIAAAAGGTPVRVCLDLDASFKPLDGRIAIGAKRTPLHAPEDAVVLAREIERRPHARLVGLMSYEGHIAGLGDVVPGNPARSAAIRLMQRASYRELRERRARAVALVREVADLAFVNAGGTGDVELAASEPAVTEVTAGSGLYAPALFDRYRRFSLTPAALFALPVVRRPGPGVVTLLGGGYLASGAAGADRLPQPWLPAGLRLDRDEGAGEVQTPVAGAAADGLRVGDNVYLRHAKAGELCERFDRLLLVRGAEVVDEVATYRGDGQTFL